MYNYPCFDMKHILFRLLLLSIPALFSSCKPDTSKDIKPQRKDIVEYVFATGTLESDDRYAIIAQTDGTLYNLTVKEGGVLKSGQQIAIIDNAQSKINVQTTAKQLKIAKDNLSDNAPVLKQLEANIKTAKTTLEQDIIQEGRFKELYEQDAVTKLEYENYALKAKTTQSNLEALQQQYKALKLQNEQAFIQQKNAYDLSTENNSLNVVRASIGGKLYQLYKENGDYVRRGEVIASIANPNKLYAKLNVDENSIDKVKLQQEAIIQLNTQANKNYKASVAEIMPLFDVATQSFIVKLQFVEEPTFTINGTPLEVNIKVNEKKNALIIPRNYMYYGNQVQLKSKEDLKTITPGIISTDYVEVLEGLTEQDILVPIKPKK